MLRRLFKSRQVSPDQGSTGIDYVFNVKVLSIVSLVIFLGMVVGYTWLYFIHRDPKIWIAVAVVLVAMGLSTIASYLVRHNRAIPAAWVILIAIAFVVPLMPLVFSGISNLIILLEIILLLVGGLQLLPPRHMIFVTLLNLAVTIVFVLVNRYPPFTKVVAPELTQIVWINLVVGGLSVVVLMFWSYRALSLSGKLLVTFTIVTLFITGVFTYLSQTQTSAALTNNAGAELQRQASQMSESIGEMLHTQINSLRSLGVSELLQRWVVASNRTYSADTPGMVLSKMNELDHQWQQILDEQRFSDPAIRTRLENDVALDLVEYAKIFPNNSELILTDINGGLIAATNVTSDYYQGDEYWWRATYNDSKGAVYISKPAYDDSLKAEAMILAIPIQDRASGQVIGVLRTTLLINSVIETLAQGNQQQNSKADLYFPGDTTQLIHDGVFGIARPEIVAQLSHMTDRAYMQMEYDGVQSLVSRAPVGTITANPDIAKLGWYTVMHQEAAVALAPVVVQRELGLAVTAIIVSLVSLLAVGVAQAFANPIEVLTGVAEQVRAGNLNAKASIRSEDEIGRLGATFNAMTLRLRETLTGLEQSISERTRELTLAGNVGRTLSQERDTTRLLKLAVELIRSTFDLYYTQIYLTDPSGKSLILSAGSGTVGAELVRRGHRLAIGPGSLNGAAAADQEPVIVHDTALAANFKPNALLPDTRSEMAVPLMVGTRVVGVLDMQSRKPEGLTQENLPAFQALAGQLAIAVDNAELFAQTQAARQEVERQARRMTRTAWDEYLDSVQRPEHLGYTYKQSLVTPLDPAGQALEPDETEPEEDGRKPLQAPILVANETIGKIALERDARTDWTEEEVELVNAVAAQVARQVENLRLLEQADRYRRDAELAAQRLVREGWEGFTSTLNGDEVGFIYDQNQTLPFKRMAVAATPVVQSYPLLVRDEKIGELVLEGEQVLDETAQQMIQAVTERLSAHLENLRLSVQTQSALVTTESLYRGSDQVVRAATPDDVLRAVAENTPLRRFAHGSIILFNRPWVEEIPEKGIVAAAYERSGETPMPGGPIDLRNFPLSSIVHPGEPTFIADIDTDERLDPTIRQIMRPLGTSLVIFPLETGGLWIGWLSMAGTSVAYLTEEEVRQVQTLVSQAASVLQSMQLLEQSQNRAQRERTLRQVAERVRSAVDTERVLQAAAREVGAALGRKVLIRLGTFESSTQATPGDGNGSLVEDAAPAQPRGNGAGAHAPDGFNG